MIYSSKSPLVRATIGSSGYDLKADLSGRKTIKSSSLNTAGYFENLGLEFDGSNNEVTLSKGNMFLIPTGVYLQLPVGIEGQVRPRSSSNFKLGIDVILGTIDSDYRGEVMIQVRINSNENVVIKHGQAIAQLIFAPTWGLIEHIDSKNVTLDEFIETASDTNRGTGGFGSTDAKA